MSSVSLIALLAAFAASEHGGLALTVSEAGAANASLTITMEAGGPDLVAPYASWFKATGLSGFNVSEPAGTDNVFDPTAREITFIWDFDDAGYQFAHTPNLPTAWRDPSVAYGKQVAHVFHTHGTFTVSCFAFDRAGNWGTATMEVTIADPDVFFAGDKTIFVSVAGVFTDKPTGAQESTSAADLVAKRTALTTAGTPHARIMFRRGETFTGWSGFGLVHTGLRTYICDGGAAGQPRPIFQNSAATWLSIISPQNTMEQITVSGLDIRERYDATKEIGITRGDFNFIYDECPVLFHRMRAAGDRGVYLGNPNGPSNTIWHDFERTNWEFYGLYHQSLAGSRLAIIGCDIYQHLDALSGNYMENGNSTNTIGNKQGCYRGSAGQVYFGCSSFFNRGGWSNQSPSTGIDYAPTAEQPLWRLSTGTPPGRQYWVFDRIVAEGGLQVEEAGGGDTRNVLFDKLLIVPNPGSFFTTMVSLTRTAYTFRNCYFVRLAADSLPYLKTREADFTATTVAAGYGRNEFYNNTILVTALTGQIGSPYVGLASAAATDVENNVIRVASRSIGDTLEPLGTSVLSGFTSRWKGYKWGFPVIGGPSFGAGTRTVADFSGGGDVLNNGTITVPYPDYTGYCNGAGFPTTQALCQANSTQFHQVSVQAIGKRNMSPSAAGGTGEITVSFGASDITITNTSGITWPAASQIWIRLDLSDYLMDFVPGSSTFGQTVPVPLPATGSDAILGSRTGLFSHGDFFGTVREDELQTTGIAVTNRVVRQGAFG